MRLHPFLEFGGPIAYAHRGGAREHLENTMKAFEAVMRSGYVYLDLEVQATADGVLVTHRSDIIEGDAGQKEQISKLPYERVAQMRVAGTEAIPRLADLLASFPQAKCNLRPGSEAADDSLMALAKTGNILGRVCVASRSLERLEAWRDAFGETVCTALSPSEIIRLALGAAGLPSGRIGGRCAQVPMTWPTDFGPWRVDERFVHTAHTASIPVHVGVVDERADMVRLIELGADGLMTDRPSELQAVLEANGMWWKSSNGSAEQP